MKILGQIERYPFLGKFVRRGCFEREVDVLIHFILRKDEKLIGPKVGDVREHVIQIRIRPAFFHWPDVPGILSLNIDSESSALRPDDKQVLFRTVARREPDLEALFHKLTRDRELSSPLRPVCIAPWFLLLYFSQRFPREILS